MNHFTESNSHELKLFLYDNECLLRNADNYQRWQRKYREYNLSITRHGRWTMWREVANFDVPTVLRGAALL